MFENQVLFENRGNDGFLTQNSLLQGKNAVNTVNQLKIGKMVFNWLTVFRV
jgi:hypothetical protein